MTVIAQQKPDFSGDWTLNRQASTLSSAAAAFQSGAMRIDHREPVFRCQATYVADGKPFEYTFELRSDGPGLRWDGDALVSTFDTQGPDGAVTISFRYELQEGGRRLQAAEQLRGGGRDQDNVWVYERP
jgi:hypothetical protein